MGRQRWCSGGAARRRRRQGGGRGELVEERRATIRRLPTFVAHLVGWRAPAVSAAAQESEAVFGLRQKLTRNHVHGQLSRSVA